MLKRWIIPKQREYVMRDIVFSLILYSTSPQVLGKRTEDSRQICNTQGPGENTGYHIDQSKESRSWISNCIQLLHGIAYIGVELKRLLFHLVQSVFPSLYPLTNMRTITIHQIDVNSR